MWSLVRGDPDTITRWARQILLMGMALIAFSIWCDSPGIITGVFAVGLGASGACLVQWRTERGLWMLAGLFFVLYCFIHTCIVFGQFNDAICGAAPVGFGLGLDAAIGTTILSAQLRFLWAVFKANITVTRSAGDS